MHPSIAAKSHRIRNATRLRLFLALCLSLATVLLFSCKDKSEKKTYSEVQGFDSPVKANEIKAPAELQNPPDAGTQAPNVQNPHAGMEAPRPAGKLTWQLPVGWTSHEGSGMYYAILRTGPEASAGEVSIIALQGEAGGMQANVERWLGQLGLQLPAATVESFIAKSKKVRTQGNLELTLLDFSSMVPGDGNSMLIGITKPGDDSFFIKMMGPKAALAGQKKNFSQFCNSLVFK